MKDLHCHLLPGIDDGCGDIEESLHILKQAEEAGVTEMLVTPHYIVDSKYSSNNKNKKKTFDKLVKEAKKRNISVKLYLGNEIYISDKIVSLLNNDEIKTLHKSKYLLIEFPLGNMFQNTKDILYELILSGYIPILAHPERYRIFQRHPEHMEEYLRMGVLLQGNYKSLFGKYGKDAKKTIQFFLKKGWITFLGSDTHHEEDFQMKKLQRKLKFIVKDSEVIADLMSNNFDKVITNTELGIRR